MTRKTLIQAAGIPLAGLLVVVLGLSLYWHAAPPARTCASCHEIESAHQAWADSPHRDIGCAACHGSAVSSGLHSLTEKARMVLVHFGRAPHEEIRLTERQVIETAERCRTCHQREYADWLSGGHSPSYADVFLDERHNQDERLSESCLRCHGMFFEGTISDLVTPLDVGGPWRLVDPATASLPVIPCLACHRIHAEGFPAVRPDYSDPATIAAQRASRSARVGFYDRYERMHFEAVDLPAPWLVQGGATVEVASDVRQRVCAQCHAPNGFHQAGSADDRTPRGVHEGLSCGACHAPHSNDASGSCANCHPRLSNCGIAVDTMDTSFRDPDSPHNIHFVACADCHERAFLRRVGRITDG